MHGSHCQWCHNHNIQVHQHIQLYTCHIRYHQLQHSSVCRKLQTMNRVSWLLPLWLCMHVCMYPITTYVDICHLQSCKMHESHCQWCHNHNTQVHWHIQLDTCHIHFHLSQHSSVCRMLQKETRLNLIEDVPYLVSVVQSSWSIITYTGICHQMSCKMHESHCQWCHNHNIQVHWHIQLNSCHILFHLSQHSSSYRMLQSIQDVNYFAT